MQIVNIDLVTNWFVFNRVIEREIYIIAIFLFLAYLLVLLSKKFKIPIIIAYVILGILLSVDIINLIPFLSPEQKEWYEFILKTLDYLPNIALAFIAFTIGSELSLRILKGLGKGVFYIVFAEVLAVFILVTLAVTALGQPIYLALILGSIAASTAPAATVLILKEYNAKGPLTSTLVSVVAIDNALALIIFSLVKPLAYILYSTETSITFLEMIFYPLIKILISIILGLLIGYISQKLIIMDDDKTKKVFLLILTIIGSLALAIYLNLSPLITNMSIGFAYRNFARKNLGIADYLDTLMIPLYAFFFILAGTKVRFSGMTAGFLIIVLVYFLARGLGKIGGAFYSAKFAINSENVKKYLGLCLLSHSGVSIALAYSVQREFSMELGLIVFNILLLGASLSEIIGPALTKYALTKAGEVKNLTDNYSNYSIKETKNESI